MVRDDDAGRKNDKLRRFVDENLDKISLALSDGGTTHVQAFNTPIVGELLGDGEGVSQPAPFQTLSTLEHLPGAAKRLKPTLLQVWQPALDFPDATAADVCFFALLCSSLLFSSLLFSSH